MLKKVFLFILIVCGYNRNLNLVTYTMNLFLLNFGKFSFISQDKNSRATLYSVVTNTEHW